MIASVILLVCGAKVYAQQDVRPDYPRAVTFFHKFQDALARNDRDQISSWMEYPVLVELHGRKARIKSRRELLKHFDEIFDEGVRCTIKTAKDNDVWGNSHGFTVNDGVIWFDAFSPPGTNDDVSAPDFWTKGTFLVMTVNNGGNYQCKE